MLDNKSFSDPDKLREIRESVVDTNSIQTAANTEKLLSLTENLNADMKQYLDSKLSETNTALEEQLAIAKSEAASAKKDARFSKVVSIVSVIIAIAAIVIPPLLF